MPASEAARNDLYNGLAELLGPERAEILMAYLPHYDPNEVARRLDVDRVETHLERLDTRIDRFQASTKAEIGRLEDRIDQLRIETTAGLTAVNARLDKLFLSLIGGLIVFIATVLGAAFTVL